MDYTNERKQLYDYYVINGDARKSAEELKIRVYAAMDDFAAKHPGFNGISSSRRNNTAPSRRWSSPCFLTTSRSTTRPARSTPTATATRSAEWAHANGWVTETQLARAEKR